jgi:peptide/nickel transport system permease protein
MSIAAQRRRRSFAQFANSFRKDRTGMTGLVILAIFIVTAILAPILIPESALDVTKADGGRFESPSFSYPFC